MDQPPTYAEQWKAVGEDIPPATPPDSDDDL